MVAQMFSPQNQVSYMGVTGHQMSMSPSMRSS